MWNGKGLLRDGDKLRLLVRDRLWNQWLYQCERQRQQPLWQLHQCVSDRKIMFCGQLCLLWLHAEGLQRHLLRQLGMLQYQRLRLWQDVHEPPVQLRRHQPFLRKRHQLHVVYGNVESLLFVRILRAMQSRQ
jgi:hypothetical protein